MFLWMVLVSKGLRGMGVGAYPVLSCIDAAIFFSFHSSWGEYFPKSIFLVLFGQF